MEKEDDWNRILSHRGSTCKMVSLWRQIWIFLTKLRCSQKWIQIRFLSNSFCCINFSFWICWINIFFRYLGTIYKDSNSKCGYVWSFFTFNFIYNMTMFSSFFNLFYYYSIWKKIYLYFMYNLGALPLAFQSNIPLDLYPPFNIQPWWQGWVWRKFIFLN